MWLPKSKYTVKYARVGDMKNTDGTDYVGKYMEAYDGRCYAGTEFSKDTKEIVRNLPEGSTDIVHRTVNVKFEPDQMDFDKGQITRYFRQSLVSKKIEEISEKDYGDLIQDKEANKSYKFATCVWLLKGPAEDLNFNKGGNLMYRYKGVRTRNSETIEEINKELPGIKDVILTDPLEKVLDTTSTFKI